MSTSTLSFCASVFTSTISPSKSESGPEVTLTDSPSENWAWDFAAGHCLLLRAIAAAFLPLRTRLGESAIDHSLVEEIHGSLHAAEPARSDGPLELGVVAGVGGHADLAGGDGRIERIDDVAALEHVERARVQMGDVDTIGPEQAERRVDTGRDARARPVVQPGDAVADLRR